MTKIDIEAMEKKIEDLLRHTDLEEWEIEDLTNKFLDLFLVSKSLSDLKNLLAEMTIELITTEQDCRERHLLIRDIEEAKESLKVLK